VVLVPAGVVTVTSTVTPKVPAGEVAVQVMPPEVWQDTLVAGVEPKLTVESGVNPVPVMVTAVPPPGGPALGLTPVTVGTPKLNWSARDVALEPAVVTTVTSTVPAVSIGVLAVQDVDEEQDTLVPGVAPKLTVSPRAKPEPVIVTVVPPAVGPAVGLIALTVGAPP
jgi:hypothetical protein